MNFSQFETLLLVARLGTFRAASRHLKLTQPAVSTRIRELERELGVELFDRSAHQARLTPKGRELLAYAERVVALAEEIQQGVGRRDAVAGKVRLGVTSIPARTWLPRLARSLGRSHPGIEIEILVKSSEHLRDELTKGGLDVAFLAGPFRSPHMRTDVIGHVAMSWLASPSLDLPLTPLTAKDMEPWPIISAPQGSHLFDLAAGWFRDGGAQLRRNHSCSSLTTRIALAVEGIGVAIATPAAAARELAEGRLRIVITTAPLPSLEYVVAFPLVAPSTPVQIVAGIAKQLITEKEGLQFYYSSGELRLAFGS